MKASDLFIRCALTSPGQSAADHNNSVSELRSVLLLKYGHPQRVRCERRALENENVDYIFGVPGASPSPFAQLPMA